MSATLFSRQEQIWRDRAKSARQFSGREALALLKHLRLRFLLPAANPSRDAPYVKASSL
jgi:hypothetical protein